MEPLDDERWRATVDSPHRKTAGGEPLTNLLCVRENRGLSQPRPRRHRDRPGTRRPRNPTRRSIRRPQLGLPPPPLPVATRPGHHRRSDPPDEETTEPQEAALVAGRRCPESDDLVRRHHLAPRRSTGDPACPLAPSPSSIPTRACLAARSAFATPVPGRAPGAARTVIYRRVASGAVAGGAGWRAPRCG